MNNFNQQPNKPNNNNQGQPPHPQPPQPPQPPQQYPKPSQPYPQYSQPQPPQKKKMKKWQIALIIVGVMMGIGILGSAGSNDDTTPSTSAETSVAEKQAEEKEKGTEPPTKSPEEIEKEFKESCSEIDFKTLSRNPDKHKGEKYKMTGEVIQVQEASFGNTVDLRINVTKEVTEFEYSDDWELWTDTIYATVELDESADRILQEDIITFWGTCDGMYSYTSVLGSTVSLPKIDIEYFELVSE